MADDFCSQCAAESGVVPQREHSWEISLCSTVFEWGSLREIPFDQLREACRGWVNSTRRVCGKQRLDKGGNGELMQRCGEV